MEKYEEQKFANLIRCKISQMYENQKTQAILPLSGMLFNDDRETKYSLTTFWRTARHLVI